MGGVTGFWQDRRTRGFEKVWWSRGVRSAGGRWSCAARVVGRRGGRGVVYWSGEGSREGGCGGLKERDPVEDDVEGQDVEGPDALDVREGRREGGCGGPKEKDPVEDDVEGPGVEGPDALDGGEERREGGCGGPKDRDPVEDNIEGSDVAGLDALDGGGGRRALVRCDGKVGRRKGF